MIIIKIISPITPIRIGHFSLLKDIHIAIAPKCKLLKKRCNFDKNGKRAFPIFFFLTCKARKKAINKKSMSPHKFSITLSYKQQQQKIISWQILEPEQKPKAVFQSCGQDADRLMTGFMSLSSSREIIPMCEGSSSNIFATK